MSKKLLLTVEARRDIAEADAWYEERSTGLGERFLYELQRCFVYILQHPKGFQRVHDEFRQAPLSVFPYVVFYRIEKDQVVVVRVFHASQHPKKRFKKRK